MPACAIHPLAWWTKMRNIVAAPHNIYTSGLGGRNYHHLLNFNKVFLFRSYYMRASQLPGATKHKLLKHFLLHKAHRSRLVRKTKPTEGNERGSSIVNDYLCVFDSGLANPRPNRLGWARGLKPPFEFTACMGRQSEKANSHEFA